METYVKLLNAGDAEGIMTLFGDNPTVEDPVGGKPVAGREAVRAFYAAAAPGLKGHVELVGPVRVAMSLEGAMPMVAELTGARKGFIDVIDTMKFDENGKIIAMRAYWNPGEVRPTR
jgi:steroid delta-isomerase